MDIAEVARLTGLTARALRFYEARGLVAPLRTASGRRIYGQVELARLHQLLALKRAGLSLARIRQLLDGRPFDLRGLVAVQLEAVTRQQQALAEPGAVLRTILSRIDRGEPIDAETFCSLIRSGEDMMKGEAMKQVVAEHFTAAEQAAWRAHAAGLPDGFDADAYGAQWRELGARVEAALPLDPASEQAQALLDEWFALLKPFSAVATPEMWKGATDLYQAMPQWEARADAGFSQAVWQFIQAATQARGLPEARSTDRPG
jgi:MerR family transcriptional regulator, thiopeptide resistance regulator